MADVANLNSVSYKRSLLIGMLLGNAHAYPDISQSPKLAVQFSVYYPLSHLDFVQWQASEITRLFNIQCNVIHKPTGQVGFSFIAGKRVRIVHDWFYYGTQKNITTKIRFMNHPIGLAILLCDKGHFTQQNITLLMQDFSSTALQHLITHIQTISGAWGELSATTIYFDAENSQRLWNYVQAWIPSIDSIVTSFMGKNPNNQLYKV